MRRAGMTFLAILTPVLLLAGCVRAKPTMTPATLPTPAPAPVTSPPAPQLGGGMPGPAQGPIRRGMDRVNAQNQLRQIGAFYTTYKDEMGHPPARLEEFLAYIKREAPQVYQSLETGYFVLNLTPNPKSSTVLAYEKDPYNDGTRLVLLGDANSVQMMDAATFEAAQKASGQ